MPHAGCSRPASGRPRFDLADLIREHADALHAQHPLSSEQAKVLRALTACRTAALGGHLDRCLDCGYEKPAYNSCRNRHCPKCQALDQARWLDARMETLLPVPYFHVVFTLPSELRPIGVRNRRRLFELLFRAASDTLLTLGHDPHHLGAQLGFTMVLHTWTRDLLFHPHLHAVVTGGGLSADGQRWVAADPDYLFPMAVLSRLFRGKMLAALRREHQRQPLDLPVDLRLPDAFSDLLRRLYELPWVTYAKPPFAGPQQVFAYLGRYTHRVALSNHRLLDVTAGSVILRTRGEHTVTLAPVELLRRFLLHLLPSGFVRIRHYGLLAASHLATRLAAARSLLREPSYRDEGSAHTLPSPATPSADSAPPPPRGEHRPCPETTTPGHPRDVMDVGDPPADSREQPARGEDWHTLFLLLTGIDPTCCPACGSKAWIRIPLAARPITRAPPERLAA